MREVYSKKEKKLLKEYEEVEKKVIDLEKVLSKSADDSSLIEGEYKAFLSMVERMKRWKEMVDLKNCKIFSLKNSYHYWYVF